MTPLAPAPPRARRPRSSAATIHDVAARAGVSVATVSRVLNGKQLVREETTRSVLEAASALRYVPNVAARSLSSRSTQTIGVLLPDVHGEFFSEVIRGIDRAARAEGYHVLVSGWHSDVAEMLAMINTMRGRVDGLILMAPDIPAASLREQLSTDLPSVLLNSADDGHPGVTIDNFGGAGLMMAHLAALGHERIAFIKGPAQNRDARERLRGYRRAMKKIKGTSADASLELSGDFSEESGIAAALQILASPNRPTAVFAANDSMAVGAMSAFAGAGLTVPDDIAVTGFDDIPIARYITPALTTVRVDLADFGHRGLSLMLECIRDPANQVHRRECATTTLVVRRSCGEHQPRISNGSGLLQKRRGRT